LKNKEAPLQYLSKLFGSYSIHFGCHLKIAADPDPDAAYHFDADPDPDPAYHFDTDPDPDQACHFDADPDPQHCLLPHCRTFR
jgi:hypothetical protein